MENEAIFTNDLGNYFFPDTNLPSFFQAFYSDN